MTARLTPTERSAIARANVERRWARHRAQRLAEGLPPTREAQIGRAPRFLSPDIEPEWLDIAEQIGLTDRLSSTERRKVAKRLHDATQARRDTTVGRPSDSAMLADYWRAERARWSRRAARSRRDAEIAEQRAHDARSRLGLILLEAGDS